MARLDTQLNQNGSKHACRNRGWGGGGERRRLGHGGVRAIMVAVRKVEGMEDGVRRQQQH
jgi:hypothetical protein